MKKSGEKALFKKVTALLEEIVQNPKVGTGKPEQLKHHQVSVWSRRIFGKHRLVYEIHDEEIIIILLSAYGHYTDK
ncbi:Txe/YoeB family addiction module toxin [Chryseobacterium salipaludis]|uniref:Txe/YoeB family addiction module toxin n=1 Tax=Planobacterium sp. JC490 TaxID=2994550 RepID=UPI001FF4F4E0|nr:Txe/YoeB family addiction module toxin [Planobacterium sp. JC490]MCJ8498389.1 Txe/YoeB family addiction module toxin [Chryseobacterium salipaludis]